MSSSYRINVFAYANVVCDKCLILEFETLPPYMCVIFVAEDSQFCTTLFRIIIYLEYVVVLLFCEKGKKMCLDTYKRIKQNYDYKTK